MEFASPPTPVSPHPTASTLATYHHQIMDILRAEAEQLLQDLPFEPAEKYEAIHIKSSRTDYANVTFEDRILNDPQLQDFINYSPSSSDIISTKIVRMHYHPDRGIKSLSSVFQNMWHSFHLDPYMMYMFHRNVPGFFQFSSTSARTPLLNFYVNCQAHWLLWTYDPSNCSTNAILLSRTSPGGPAAYPQLHARLRRFSGLAGHPLFLASVALLERIAYVDIFLREQHHRIGRAEKHTGFSHFHINNPRPHIENTEVELNKLSDLSRSASSVLVGLGDMVQHLQSSTAIVEAMLGSSLIQGMQGLDLIMRKETEIKDIASVISPQLKQRFGYISFIKERAQNQLTVIFNLLARGDAQANIDIAKAVMHDSTSMKTIAVMTMCFLPATFYAALFSVPSLQWDQPTVIGRRFWVYWAVTIPTTILVFVIWFGMMYGRKISGGVKQRSNRAGEKIVMERWDASA